MALLVGCPPQKPNGPKKDPVAYDCELGLLDAKGVFTRLPERREAEIILGFQGLIFAEVVARSWQRPPSTSMTTYSLTVAGEQPLGGYQPQLRFDRQGDAWVSEPVLVYLSGVPGNWDDKTGDVALRIEGNNRVCVAQGRIHLVDDDDCIHTGQDIICPEDTG